MRRTRKGTSTASTWRAQALSRGACLEMLSACLALYFGQLSYNPGKVGWFGNLGRGQSSDNPRKVGGFGPLRKEQSSDNPGKVESSYNPGKVGGFGDLGKGQLSYNPGKVGGFTHAKGIVG